MEKIKSIQLRRISFTNPKYDKTTASIESECTNRCSGLAGSETMEIFRRKLKYNISGNKTPKANVTACTKMAAFN